MKEIILFIFSILFATNLAFSQGKQPIKYTNPFEQAGIKGIKILTLSKGKYQEFHDLDSVVQIGTTLINVNTRKIVGFVKKDSTNSMPDASVSSRWISVDPLAEHTYNMSPYNFGYNNPIRWNDPDGRCPICPYLAKGGAAATADVMMQMVMSYAFDDDVKTVGDAFGKVDWTQAGISGVQGMIPWNLGNKYATAALVAVTDVGINATRAQLEGRAYTMEEAARDFAVGLMAQGGAELTEKLMTSIKFQKLYRVQGGGDLPNVSKERFTYKNGKLNISGDDMLYVNFGDSDRAIKFLQKRGEGAYLVEVNVDRSFVNKIKKEAVSQRVGKANPGKPQQVDQTVTNNSYGIPQEYFQELLKNIDPKSVKIIPYKEN